MNIFRSVRCSNNFGHHCKSREQTKNVQYILFFQITTEEYRGKNENNQREMMQRSKKNSCHRYSCYITSH